MPSSNCSSLGSGPKTLQVGLVWSFSLRKMPREFLWKSPDSITYKVGFFFPFSGSLESPGKAFPISYIQNKCLAICVLSPQRRKQRINILYLPNLFRISYNFLFWWLQNHINSANLEPNPHDYKVKGFKFLIAYLSSLTSRDKLLCCVPWPVGRVLIVYFC